MLAELIAAIDHALDQWAEQRIVDALGISGILGKLTTLETKLDAFGATIHQLEINVDQELENLRVQVEADTAATTGAVTLLTQLGDMIRAAADDPAAVRALADTVAANATALSEAIVANTPAAPAA